MKIMEKKYIKVSFDVEMAKRISNGEVDGKIITRDGRNVRVVCWDARWDLCILALLAGKSKDDVGAYPNDGRIFMEGESPADLMLEVPEYMTFKDGDIATLGWKTEDGRYCEWITILKEIDVDNFSIFTYDYVTLCLKSDKDNHFSLEFDCKSDAADWVRKSTEEEKQRLIDALKESKELKAIEYRKRFFGIEEKKEYEFKPFDKVLVRDNDNSEWCVNIFSHQDNRETLPYRCIDDWYRYCIPYNEQTAYLLGTIDNYEE